MSTETKGPEPVIVFVVDDETRILSGLLRFLSTVPGVIPEPCLVRDRAELTRCMDRLMSLVGNRDPYLALCDFDLGESTGDEVRGYLFDAIDAIADLDADMDVELERSRFVYHSGRDASELEGASVLKGDTQRIRELIERMRDAQA